MNHESGLQPPQVSLDFIKNIHTILSMSYAGKNEYSAGKTSGVLRGGASRDKRAIFWPIVPPPLYRVKN